MPDLIQDRQGLKEWRRRDELRQGSRARGLRNKKKYRRKEKHVMTRS